MDLVAEPDVEGHRQAPNNPDQFVDDAAAYLLIDVLRDALNRLVSGPAGDFLNLVLSEGNGLVMLKDSGFMELLPHFGFISGLGFVVITWAVLRYQKTS